MATRRNFLKSGGAAATLLGTLGLAGCTEIENALGGGGGSSYSNWLYDPSELISSEYEAFGTFNVQSIYENREQIPDEVFEDLEEANEELSNFGVDLEETEDMTGIGFSGNILSSFGGSGGMNEVDAGGSVAISGSFDVDDVESAVELANGEVPSDQRLEEDGEYEGYNMWTTVYEQMPPGSENAISQSAAAALSEENIVVGGMQTAETDESRVVARDAVELMIDTEGGSGTRWKSENDDASEMIDNVGGDTFAMGATLGTLVDFAGNFIEEESVQDVLDGLVAVGVGVDINGETYETNIAMVYGDSEDADTDSYEAFFEYLREQNNSDVEDPFEDIQTSKNGRTIVVTTTGDTAELFESAGDGSMEGTQTDLGALDLTSIHSTSDIVGAATPGGGMDFGN